MATNMEKETVQMEVDWSELFWWMKTVLAALGFITLLFVFTWILRILGKQENHENYLK